MESPLDTTVLQTIVFLNLSEPLAGRDQERRVTICTRADAERVWVEVADNGPGIFRKWGNIPLMHSSLKPNGLGMGFAVSHSVVSALGGSLGYSRLDQGGLMFHRHFPRLQT